MVWAGREVLAFTPVFILLPPKQTLNKELKIAPVPFLARRHAGCVNCHACGISHFPVLFVPVTHSQLCCVSVERLVFQLNTETSALPVTLLGRRCLLIPSSTNLHNQALYGCFLVLGKSSTAGARAVTISNVRRPVMFRKIITIDDYIVYFFLIYILLSA